MCELTRGVREAVAHRHRARQAAGVPTGVPVVPETFAVAPLSRPGASRADVPVRDPRSDGRPPTRGMEGASFEQPFGAWRRRDEHPGYALPVETVRSISEERICPGETESRGTRALKCRVNP